LFWLLHVIQSEIVGKINLESKAFYIYIAKNSKFLGKIHCFGQGQDEQRCKMGKTTLFKLYCCVETFVDKHDLRRRTTFLNELLRLEMIAKAKITLMKC
jgi:hypothetical protein